MHNYGHWKRTLALLVMSALSLGASSVDAMPEGGVVRSGSGSVTQNGKEMTIRQDSGRMAMDWTGFSVGKDETVRFQQPGKDALALNRVTGNQQSVIDGSLLSNGHVLLVNPNGVVIGKNASIDVGGLVASTAQVKDNFMKEFGNSTGAFSLGGVSDGKIINEGTIKAEGGLVALHAAKVENSGTISNTGGSAVLAAADTLTLTPDADGKLNFTVDGKAAEASALNKGAITADGGTIVMTADSASDVMSTVVNNSGTLQARTLRKNEKGQILLEGGDKGQVEVSGTLDASGTEEGQSAGNIKVIGEKTIVHDGTNLLAKGNEDGGKIETSGDVLNLGDNLNIDAKGVNGKAGEWLLDPLDVYICDDDPTKTYDSKETDIKKYETDGSLTQSTSIGYHDPAQKESADASATSTGITWIKTKTITDLLNKGTDVTIQAAATNGVANITVNSPIKKESGEGATFTLDAMRNITINKEITSTSGKLNVKLNSDTNGNKVGAVIINADIDTNGGDFTSTSGGNTIYTSSSTTKGYDLGTFGTDSNVDPQKVTVGTYFGNINDKFVADGSKSDRSITTKGGSITLNGEVAIGLAGGALNLDSATKDADGNTVGGDVTVTGIINSGNSYATYIYGTDAWKDLIVSSGLVDEYLNAGTVPSYHYEAVNYVKNPDGTYKVDANGNYETTTDKQTINGPHYTFSEANTEDPRWIGTGNGLGYSTTNGEGWTSVKVTETSVEKSMTVKEFLVYYKTAAKDSFNAKYKNVDLTKDNATIVAAIKSDPTLLANLTADINDLLSVNWFVAKNLAQGDDTKGGSAVGATYLATLTTILENSLTAPESSTALFVGARGSGVLSKTGKTNEDKKLPYSYYGLPDDPLYSNGMYWVTGPEGEANNGKGTQFYSNVGSDWSKTYKDSEGKTTYNSGTDVYGFVNWSTWPQDGVTRTQPDNSGPFLTVGYGANSQWDDTSMAGGYGGAQSAWAKGFVQEKNLANSSLKINSGTGEVKLQGDIGKSKALDTVSIESTNAVTVGTDNNNVTDYYHGTIYVDHGLYISGNGVKVGGEIHSGESEETDTSTTLEDTYKDNVTILSSGDIEVHGITSNTYNAANKDGTTTTRGGKISLTSTGDKGKITLGAGVDYDGNITDGTLAAASTAEGAVVVDAQGSQGSLVNNTTGTNAITTGKDGTWQVYSASPDNNTFGTNLNSEKDAQWTSKSASNNIATQNKYGKTPDSYSDTSSNKFIFQATPVITLYTDDYLKTYGDEVSADTLNKLLKGKEVVFTGLDGKSHNVNDYSSAFQEKDYTEYISGADTVTVTSDGSTATATRTGGKYEATDKSGTDGKNAVYDLTVNLKDAKALDGYAIDTENGKLEIKKRTASITGTGTQTYGDTDGTIKNWTDTQTNIADGSTVSYTTSIKSDSDYTKNKGSRNTADHGTYNDSVSFDGLTITDSNGNEVDIADNYDLTTTGTIDVAKAKLTLTVGNTETTYGTAFDPKTYTYTLSGNTNGDTAEDVEHNKISVTYTNGGERSDAANDKVKTQNVGSYNLTGTFTLRGDTEKNYEIGTVNAGKAEVTPAEIHLKLNNVSTTYGTDFDTSKYGYDASKLEMANGDSTDVVTKAIGNGDITYTNTGDATDPDNENVKTQNAGTGYKLTGTTEKTLQNYKVIIDGADSTVDKADLTLTLKDVSTTYGNEFDGKTYGYKKDTADLQGLTNGDAAAAITDVLQDSDFTYLNGGEKSDASNKAVKTQNAGSYQITGSTSKTLDNYNIKVVNPGTSTVEKAELTLTVGDVSTVYGTGFDKTKYTYTISGNANGDTDETLKNNQISVNYTNTGEKADANNDKVKTQDVEDWKLIGDFTVAGDTANNYDFTYVNGTSTVTPAEIHLKLNDVSTTYGTSFDTNKYGYDASKLEMANGDSTEVVTKAIGNRDITYTNTGDATDPDKIAKGAKTQDAGTGYQLTGTTEKTLQNYTVKIDGADASIDKATLKLKVGDYTEAYGAADKVGADLKQTEVTGEQNGDDLADLVSEIGIHNTSKALLSDTRTNDVKYKADGSLDSYRIDTQLDKDTLKNYNLELSEGTMTLTPVAITVDNEMIQTYGSADRSFKEIVTPPLVNGDTISTDGLTMTPKAGGAYETNRAGRTTANAGTYTNDLESDGGGIVHENGSDARKNYSVTIKGDIIVNPKHINTKVIGKGSTLKDLTWEIVEDPKDQMVNGDSVNFTYTPGNLISYEDQTFNVNSFINGTQTFDATTDVLPYGKNYIFHSTGKIQLTFNPIVKPDVWAHSGGYRPRNKIETALPVFRVEDAKVGQYGTYGVEHNEEGDKLVLSATGMRLPEPDQVPDEERTFTTTLSTETGSGTFQLVYNGVSLKVYPQDKEAEETVRAGDKTKNVSLSEKALYVGYTEMGLDLIDLKGVYIYFN